MRLRAIEYGRKVAAEMKRNGIVPNWQNCLDAYAKSDFAKMSYETHGHLTFSTALVNVKDLHPQINKEMKGFTQADVDWFEKNARNSHGSEQRHWIKEAQWARNHLHSFADTDVTDAAGNLSEATLKGFTQADVDWYEHQARISSGSEQAHWIKEAQWARNHLKGFIMPEPGKEPYHEGRVLW